MQQLSYRPRKLLKVWLLFFHEHKCISLVHPKQKYFSFPFTINKGNTIKPAFSALMCRDLSKTYKSLHCSLTSNEEKETTDIPERMELVQNAGEFACSVTFILNYKNECNQWIGKTNLLTMMKKNFEAILDYTKNLALMIRMFFYFKFSTFSYLTAETASF